MASTLKFGDFYETQSGRRGIVTEITKNASGRKVVEMQTIHGIEFATLPRGLRAKVSA